MLSDAVGVTNLLFSQRWDHRWAGGVKERHNGSFSCHGSFRVGYGSQSDFMAKVHGQLCRGFTVFKLKMLVNLAKRWTRLRSLVLLPIQRWILV